MRRERREREISCLAWSQGIMTEERRERFGLRYILGSHGIKKGKKRRFDSGTWPDKRMKSAPGG